MSDVSNRSSSVFVAVLLILIAMVSVQGGASIAKLLFPLVGAEGATSLRMTFGAIALSLILKPWKLRIHASNWPSLLVYGFVLGAMNFLFYQAIKTLPLGIAVAIEFIGPLTLALVSSRRMVDFVWVILAVTGLILLLPVGVSTEQIDLKGALFALSAGICWAIYILAGRKTGMKNGTGSVAIGCIIAAVFFAPIGFSIAGSAIFSWHVLPLAVAVGVLSTALPYALEMKALTVIPARAFGTLMSLEPALGALSGFMILHETLTLNQWFALLAIVVASLGATLTIRTNQKAG